MYLRPTHHAGPGEHGVMDGIRLDVAATAHEVDLDHYQVVYVVQVLTNALFCESRIATAEDEVPRGTNADLAGYMARQDELAIIPPYIDLFAVSAMSHILQSPEAIIKVEATHSPACV